MLNAQQFTHHFSGCTIKLKALRPTISAHLWSAIQLRLCANLAGNPAFKQPYIQIKTTKYSLIYFFVKSLKAQMTLTL